MVCDETNARDERSALLPGLAFLTGVIYQLPFNEPASRFFATSPLLPVWIEVGLYAALLTAIFVSLSAYSRSGRVYLILWYGVGVSVGFIIDAIIDSCYGHGRNLVGVEVIAADIIALPFVSVGTGFGWLLGKSR